jgi:hypothetical protein
VLNAIAIVAVAVAVAIVLGTAGKPMSTSARAALALVEHSPTFMRAAATVSSAIGVWLGLRGTLFARVIVRGPW